MIFKRLSVAMFVVAMLGAASGQTTALSADYHAYSAAMHHKDAQAKADALELFLKAYPSSGLRERAFGVADTGVSVHWKRKGVECSRRIVEDQPKPYMA